MDNQIHNLALYQLNYIHHTGVLGGIRTLDPRLRRAMLYPTELRAHIKLFCLFAFVLHSPKVQTMERVMRIMPYGIGYARTLSASFRWRSNYCWRNSHHLAGFSLVQTMERVMGIGPTQPAWKAGTLPLSYTRTMSYFDIITHNTATVNHFLQKSWHQFLTITKK